MKKYEKPNAEFVSFATEEVTTGPGMEGGNTSDQFNKDDYS